jgi:Domain of unknown function (DUF5916)/Carbohydrate family 9 binding domain-like
MKSFCKIVLFLVFSQIAFGQKPYLIKETANKITLDGNLDEEIWKNAQEITDFWQFFPADTALAKYQTKVYLTYDSKNIYIGARMLTAGNKYVIPSFKRDYRAGGNDNITFCFDTFNDHTNSFVFGCNPYGVNREALIYNAGTDNSFFNMAWDNKWQCAVKQEDKAWVTEMAIPFSTLRFKSGSQNWNFKVYRFDTQSNETTSLVRMPQNQIIMNLGYAIPVQFEKPLQKTGLNGSFIPYVSSKLANDFENKNSPENGYTAGFGADAKISVTSGLNLDLTANPDFSNVEADRQVVNLTRFDISLPEQRQFFNENSDLFTGFGAFNVNPFLPPSGANVGIGNQSYSPFFSRKIGIAFDSTLGVNVQNKISYGLRLSGKIDDNWRIGLMNIQTKRNDARNISADNYTVTALQRKVFDRSNIAMIFVNKVRVDEPETAENRFNRVAGLEYNYFSADNSIQGKAFFHHSFSPRQLNDASAQGLVLNYTTRKFIAKWQHDLIGAGYNAEVGFLPRKNYFHINPTIGYNIFPKSGTINRLSYGVAYDQYSNKQLGVTDRQAGPFLLMSFQSSIRFLITLNQNYTYLFNNFDALRSNGKLPNLAKGTSYTYYNINANFVSDLRKKVSFSTTPLVGQYFNGNILSLVGAVNYRFQPYGLVAMNVSYNDIKIANLRNKVYLIGPNIDLTFSKKVFLTSFVQYNSQFKNLNINSRLQYRFAPVSDFFLVYTDNYNTATNSPKNRALFAKLTYWFSL